LLIAAIDRDDWRARERADGRWLARCRFGTLMIPMNERGLIPPAPPAAISLPAASVATHTCACLPLYAASRPIFSKELRAPVEVQTKAQIQSSNAYVQQN